MIGRERWWKLGIGLFFLLALIIGTWIRYVNLFDLGFYFDTIETQYDWATTANSNGILKFWREFEGFFDYLPGALYLLTSIKWLSQFIGNDPSAFVLLLKLFNWIADISLIVLIAYVGKKYGNYTKLQLQILSGTLYLLPALWFVGGVWGQIDTFIVFLILLSIVLLFREKETDHISSPFYKSPGFYSGIILGIGLWIKLQVLLIIPVLILFYCIVRKRNIFLKQIFGFFIASVVIILPPLIINAHRLGQNLIQPYMRDDDVSKRAATLWGLLGFTDKGSDPIVIFGDHALTVATTGMILYTIAMLIFVIRFQRLSFRSFPKLQKIFPKDMTFFDFALVFAISSSLYFMLFTKMHSRYLHIGLLFAIVAGVALKYKKRAISLFIISIILSLSYTYNHMYVYIIDDMPRTEWINTIYELYKGDHFLTISFINILCIIGLFVWGWGRPYRDSLEVK